MPRRKSQKPPFDPQLFVGLLIAISVLWLIVEALSHAVVGLTMVVLLIGVPAVVIWQRDHMRRNLLQKSQTIIGRQMSALVRRRAQLIWTDAYGMPQVEKWEKEKYRFIEQHIEPYLASSERKTLQRERPKIAWLIETHVNAAAQSQPAFRNFFDNMTPTEFELFCAEQLRQAKWNARVTRQSGDQGVDIVAEKDGIRVVIQCKLYAKPVGNKSVQEVVAARGHEQAHYGIVVSNNRYTPAAEQLASTNRILLLHYSELKNLQNRLCNDLANPGIGLERLTPSQRIREIRPSISTSSLST
jgi:restriction system protein